MKGKCDICGRAAELSELPGLKDRCCGTCGADLATMVLLYTESKAAEREGRESTELESELRAVINKLLKGGGFEVPEDESETS